MTIQTEQEIYNELSLYTLAHPSKEFIHQYIVDAFAAQTANENTKPITIAFALIGLYLHLEKGYSGKEVQHAHMKLAPKKNILPTFELPIDRGDIRVSDVLNTSEGNERDQKIEKWMQSVWGAYSNSHNKIKDFLDNNLK